MAGGLEGVGHAVVLAGLPDDRIPVVLAAVVNGHADAQCQGGLALSDVAVADAVGAVGGDAEGGIEPVEGLLAGLKVFLANRKLGGLVVTEVNWTMLPAASSPPGRRSGRGASPPALVSVRDANDPFVKGLSS